MGVPVMPMVGATSGEAVSCQGHGCRSRSCSVSAVEQTDFPDRFGIRAAIRIGVEGVDRVVLRGNEKDVVDLAVTHRQSGNIEWLGIDTTVYCLREQFAEGVHIHVGGCENGLAGICSGMRQVVAPGQHAHRLGRLGQQVWRQAEQDQEQRPERNKVRYRMNHGGDQGGSTPRSGTFKHPKDLTRK